MTPIMSESLKKVNMELKFDMKLQTPIIKEQQLTEARNEMNEAYKKLREVYEKCPNYLKADFYQNVNFRNFVFDKNLYPEDTQQLVKEYTKSKQDYSRMSRKLNHEAQKVYPIVRLSNQNAKNFKIQELKDWKQKDEITKIEYYGNGGNDKKDDDLLDDFTEYITKKVPYNNFSVIDDKIGDDSQLFKDLKIKHIANAQIFIEFFR